MTLLATTCRLVLWLGLVLYMAWYLHLSGSRQFHSLLQSLGLS